MFYLFGFIYIFLKFIQIYKNRLTFPWVDILFLSKKVYDFLWLPI